jgi:activator of HSP90 ATPase
MRSVIQQSVVLPASPARLFEMYLDPIEHAAFTGHPVTIGDQPGAAFKAFGGQLSGAVMALVRPRLVVQSWRSVKFGAADPDSTLILTFTSDDLKHGSGRIDLVHLDVPDHDYQDVIAGWQKYYWTPWRAYLENRGKV